MIVLSLLIYSLWKKNLCNNIMFCTRTQMIFLYSENIQIKPKILKIDQV
jgi:hypothetical protein